MPEGRPDVVVAMEAAHDDDGEVLGPAPAREEASSDEVLGAGHLALRAPIGVDVPAAEAAGPILADDSPPPASSSNSSSNGDDEPDEILDAAIAAPEVPPPAIVDGARLRVEDRIVLSGYKRYILTCTDDRHVACIKHRNLHWRQTKNFGPCEPIVYLAVWHAKRADYLTAGDHITLCRPTVPEIRAWLQANGYI